MSQNVIDPQAILLRQTAATREEAIRKAAEPLVASHRITPLYVDAMVEVLTQVGTYMVISPGIAIAHARPSAEVLEECISLATFDPPVTFGHPSNDPVDVVFVIAAKETQHHLNAMGRIAKAMCRDDFLQVMRSAQTAQGVLTYLEGGDSQ